MGSDLTVVNSARVSFSKESDWDIGEEIEPHGEYKRFKKTLSEQDQKLIKYLAKHSHWTPFSHVQITLREKVPIFVARQRFKHMVGFSYNEVSRRYVDDAPEFFTPSEWRGRPEGSIKQGSSDEIIDEMWFEGTRVSGQIKVSVAYQDFIETVERFYSSMIKSGIAPEQARMILPQSMYTELYATGSLAAWARATNLRKDSHAQLEIQHLAQLWDKTIRGITELKYSWEALVGEKWY